MKAIEELKPIDLGEGSSMRLFIDKDKPTDSIHRRWTETAYDGTGSKPFVVPLHWHKYHDEHLLVKEGRLEMTVGNNTFVADPSTGTMIAPRNTVHGIKFFKGVKTILEEKTNPVGEFKEEFFRDLLDFNPEHPRERSFFYNMRVFYDNDTYPALPGGLRILDQAFVTIMGGVAKPFVGARQPLPRKSLVYTSAET